MRLGKDDLQALAGLLKDASQYRLVLGNLVITKDEQGKKTIERIGEKKGGAQGQLHSLTMSSD